MSLVKKAGATYEDVINAPSDKIAELIDGVLILSPRPANPANRVCTVLSGKLFPALDGGGPTRGTWIFVVEPEVHVQGHAIVPDIAGWRRERLPFVADEAAFTLVPDWVCEVLSPSTEKYDRTDKLSLYARLGVRHVWLVHPRHYTVEVMRLHEGKWLSLGVHFDDQKVRAEPFESVELDLADLWGDLVAYANEPRAKYG